MRDVDAVAADVLGDQSRPPRAPSATGQYHCSRTRNVTCMPWWRGTRRVRLPISRPRPRRASRPWRVERSHCSRSCRLTKWTSPRGSRSRPGQEGRFGTRAGGEQQPVVTESAAVVEGEAPRLASRSRNPGADALDALLVVDVALVRLEVAQGEAVHERVHQRGAGEEIVALAADDGDAALGSRWRMVMAAVMPATPLPMITKCMASPNIANWEGVGPVFLPASPLTSGVILAKSRQPRSVSGLAGKLPAPRLRFTPRRRWT